MKKILLSIIIAIMSFLLVSCNATCKVTFTVDGEVIETLDVKKGDKVKKTDYIPSKEDAIFIGWAKGNDLFDFSKPINEDTTLIAMFEKLTNVSLTKAEKLLKGYEKQESYQRLKNQVAKSIQIYNVDPTDLIDSNKPILVTLVNFLFEDSNTTDKFSFVVYLVDALMELYLESEYYYTLSASAKVTSQTFYEAVLESNLYSSNIKNYEENKEFYEFIVPVIFSTRLTSSKSTTVKQWIIEVEQNGYLPFYNITKTGNSLKFESIDKSCVYIYTYDQIEAFFNLFKNVYKNTYASTISLVTREFSDNVKKNNNKELLNTLRNNDEELASIINNVIQDLSKESLDMYNAVNILTGLKQKFTNLSDEFKNIENIDELNDAIKNAINFKDQVIAEVEMIIPDDCILTHIEELNKALCIDKFILNEGNASLVYDINLFKQYYTETVDLLKTTLSFLKTINYTNYDIDLLVSGIMSPEAQNEAFLEEVKRLETNYLASVKDIPVLNKTLNDIYSIFTEKLIFTKYDISLIVDVYFNSLLTKELIGEVSDIIKNDLSNYTGERLEEIVNATYKVLSTDAAISVEEFNSYMPIVLSIIDDISIEAFDKITPCIKEAIKCDYPSLLDDQINSLINYWRDNFEVFKKSLKIVMHIYTIELTGFSDTNKILCKRYYINTLLEDDNIYKVCELLDYTFNVLDKLDSTALKDLLESQN